MKLAYRDIESFVARPAPAARVILVYGPDHGLVAERGKAMAKTQVPDLADPFNVATLTAAQLLDDPARLHDEAFAQSLMGGNRLILIRDAADALAPLIKDYLKSPSPHTLTIIEAGELGTKSALRALAEKAENAAAIPCYVEDERDLTRFLQTAARDSGLGFDRDALAALAGALVGDRAVARGEFEKLALYKFADADKTIHLADVEACVGDVRARTFDELVHAVGQGDVARMGASLAALTREQTAAVAILRTVQGHFRRLYQCQLKIESGSDPKSAMKSLNPPVFFKFESAFQAQLQRWPRQRIENVLGALNATEAQTKQTNMPADTLCAQVLLKIAMAA
ncbi:MAG: DNA polymerase III subunit delta [Rhodospirillales bacterium]|nr:DNA polymerase III subunit delta [Alphaproteobacteria bacterium]MCB9986626.1 DNA polymerase III subunit delta [Rhodospirillales bacterium]USO06845.1 MAG: DNA polymerase III subunit delta [Rhodospirillales bacterium]